MILGEPIWLWAIRLLGVGLAVRDSLDGTPVTTDAMPFYALLIFGPSALKFDIKRQENGGHKR